MEELREEEHVELSTFMKETDLYSLINKLLVEKGLTNIELDSINFKTTKTGLLQSKCPAGFYPRTICSPNGTCRKKCIRDH